MMNYKDTVREEYKKFTDTCTHRGLDDAQTERQRTEELNAARKELEKTQGERTVSKAVFKVV